jgi:hypothetical protein
MTWKSNLENLIKPIKKRPKKKKKKKCMKILNSNSTASIEEVAGDIIVYPTLRSLFGRVQASEHAIWNAHNDTDVGPGERLENKWVSIKELHFGDVVGLQELHHLGRWERVRGRSAPVHAYGSDP